MKNTLLIFFLLLTEIVVGQQVEILNSCNSTLEVTVIIDGCVPDNTKTFILHKDDRYSFDAQRSDIYVHYHEIITVRETNFEIVGTPYNIKKTLNGKEYFYFPKERLWKYFGLASYVLVILPDTPLKT